jgi:hypothetical protein
MEAIKTNAPQPPRTGDLKVLSKLGVCIPPRLRRYDLRARMVRRIDGGTVYPIVVRAGVGGFTSREAAEERIEDIKDGLIPIDPRKTAEELYAQEQAAKKRRMRKRD